MSAVILAIAVVGGVGLFVGIFLENARHPV